ncbi:MAG: hypothetical protein ACOCSD_05490 [Halolamina sp.]
MQVVADTSALVSLGTVADANPSPLDRLLDQHTVLLPEQVSTELEETASYDDTAGEAAVAVLARRESFDVRAVDLDESFPLDDGENAAVTLANDVDATRLLCDEFNRLALVHASLTSTRLVTTPTLLAGFVSSGELSAGSASALLAAISEARSWSGNSYVERAEESMAPE